LAALGNAVVPAVAQVVAWRAREILEQQDAERGAA
jgi:hypothetical protein